MNLPTLLVLLLVTAALVAAVLSWRRSGGAGSCSCNSQKCSGSSGCTGYSGSSGCTGYSGCSGCSGAPNCPYCKH